MTNVTPKGPKSKLLRCDFVRNSWLAMAVQNRCIFRVNNPEIYMKKFIVTVALSLASLASFAKSNQIIVNFSKVNSGIYRGARLTSVEAVEYLKSLGVKNIINLQGGDLDSDIGIIIPWAEPGERAEVIAAEKASSLASGLGFFHAPLNSLEAISSNEDKVIDEVLSFMHEKENQPVFIHCEHGADRTGLLVALYRVKYEGVKVGDARAEWIANGHNRFHQLFTGDLDKYFFDKIKEYSKK
jgi:tyrosine-protein phosphatase SIW14